MLNIKESEQYETYTTYNCSKIKLIRNLYTLRIVQTKVLDTLIYSIKTNYFFSMFMFLKTFVVCFMYQIR